VGVPLETAVDLLKDVDGRIALNLPITGRVSRPDVDMGPAIDKAVGNVLATFSPLALIASMLASLADSSGPPFVSLGSSSIIANVIAGYSMAYRRPFKVGDRVKINETVGEVIEIRVLVTRLRSLNSEYHDPQRRGRQLQHAGRTTGPDLLHTSVGIGYETPWRQVEAMLKLVASRTPGLLQDLESFVLRKGLGDFAVTSELNVYCADPANMALVYSALHDNILDVFNEYGVAIMTPSYVADPAEPKLVPKEQWYAAPASPPSEPTPG
jgi:hypothetical protein